MTPLYPFEGSGFVKGNYLHAAGNLSVIFVLIEGGMALIQLNEFLAGRPGRLSLQTFCHMHGHIPVV